jgi:hypothetical protein
VLEREAQYTVRTAYERRNRDLDPQLVWRGKDEQDWRDLVVHAAPLYIQEKVHPKALIDDLLRQTHEIRYEAGGGTADLFADFNGIPKGVDKTEFYQYDQNWSNRMILGDSLQVMASLAEREGLRGKVQCTYIDPPYGIKFNSSFQWSTTSRDVKDGNRPHHRRERPRRGLRDRAASPLRRLHPGARPSPGDGRQAGVGVPAGPGRPGGGAQVSAIGMAGGLRCGTRSTTGLRRRSRCRSPGTGRAWRSTVTTSRRQGT